ncbi:E3 ubiquitin-protein ligase synoviolin [Nilaparvata lugens]|uniref:E3 ubiquitin-protein ligase synoviolin n=1 Tax=Nilaparvata lugens TaxID=108931 RepID=UPI00193D7421|nr:E3 ubiquitin-protein ligase synoviolin [Nilaparvata lugens]
MLTGKLMGKVFFGELRAAELEHLMERAWYAMTETCLAFTVFRDDFSPKFVALFTVLLFLKSFHWLAEDRVDYMERSPNISWLFHLRVVSLLAMLGCLDLHLVGHAYLSTVTKGASVQLVFGFEYAILLTIIINIAIKYVLHTIDLNSETPWENKAVFLLYTELIMGFFKVVLYIMFLAIMFRISMLPLFAFRPMYYTMRAFKKAFNDVILSRRAIRNMNTLYPDATPEELAAADNVCIICREEMLTASKKLPCNHIFHTSCLRSWFQRQQTCPTCRLNILRSPTGANTATPPRPAAAPQPQPPPHPHPQPPPPPFNFAWPPPPVPNQQPGENGNLNEGAGSSGSTAGSQAPGAAGAMPGPGMPFFCPPFPPFMPFNIPPPIPPRDFSGLSDEEVRRMESSAREGVEARLLCLRNIQMMLDASVVLMRQYSESAAIAAAQNSSMPNQSTPTSEPTTGPDRAGTSTSENATEQLQTTPPVSSNNDTPSTSGSASSPQPSTSKVGVVSEEASSSSTSSAASPTSVTQPPPLVTPEQEEARRRRLQKFASD